MDARSTIRTARARSGLTLRALGERCGTSHSTLSAYESGRVVPSVDTLARVLGGAGFDLTPTLTAVPHSGPSRAAFASGDPGAERGRELVEVLELAALFPARHARTLEYPKFGSAPRRGGDGGDGDDGNGNGSGNGNGDGDGE